jgi:thioredoxin reductase (NADPH)
MTADSPAPNSHHKVIIIGSGPAGLTAAIYTARADLAPLCIEGIESGGQLMLTTEVENYPGFPEGMQGPEMMMKFREQAERFGTTFITDDVTQVDLRATPKVVQVAGTTYTADAVIVSTGATARMLGLDSEQRLLGHGVSTCATCDGFFFRDKKIMVIGGGDSAMEEAAFLAKFGSGVTIAHRRDKYRASKIMLDRARENGKIEFLEFAEVVEVLGDDAVTAVRLRDPRDGREWERDVDGLFLAIGHTPNTQLFEGQLDMDEQGYLVVDAPHTTTNLDGVFACGDVQDHIFRQAITAAGTGCAAALDAERWLAAQGAGSDSSIDAAARDESAVTA